jgi:lipopolysaccharide/colanic/teichoic acid biosynthesis glycosyltransferase
MLNMKKQAAGKVFKRILDVLFSVLAILLFGPFILVILLITFMILKQFPVLVQERSLTLESPKIRMLKIRTIKDSSGFREIENKSEDIYFKKEFEIHVPAFCALLRRTGLDEILQLMNVLNGSMSIVGPRPFSQTDLLLMKKNEIKFYERRKKISSVPGITGVWQVWGNRTEGTKNLIELEEFYELKKSILLDLRIIIASILIGITGRNYDAIVNGKMQSYSNKYYQKVFKLKQ